MATAAPARRSSEWGSPEGNVQLRLARAAFILSLEDRDAEGNLLAPAPNTTWGPTTLSVFVEDAFQARTGALQGVMNVQKGARVARLASGLPARVLGVA